ncbi:PXA domain-containing protein [Hysterangium stoloniferum]|nr:PXA domain-containing protein [Hysterangium stoloniferum]
MSITHRRTSRLSTSHRSEKAFSTSSFHTTKAPVSLPKRLLFPHLPTGSELPSLLSADDPELNAELYDFLALALRGFVSPWWLKISRYDKEFLPEITRVVAVFLRSVEARLSIADVSSLIFKYIPTIVSQHYADYRNAASKVGTSYATGGASALPQIFHHLQPHMAVSSDGHWDETYIRQAVEHVMKTCLPQQDWDAEVERTIVREIVTKVVLGAAFIKLTQPWFIHKIALDLLGPPSTPTTTPPRVTTHKRFSFQQLVVFFLSAVQTVSGLCLAAITFGQKALHTIRIVNSSGSLVSDPRHANLAHPVIGMIAEILTMRARTSSLSALSLVRLCTGFSRPFLDKALPYILFTHIINPPQLTRIIAISKQTLFPNGYPGPPPVEPSPEEQIVLREQLEARLLTILPAKPSSLLLGPDAATRQRTIADIIDPLSSQECNVHLLILLFDAILLTIFPEMGMANGGVTSYTENDINDPIL